MSAIGWAKCQAFRKAIVAPAIEIPDLLETAVDWIAENLDPEDVFSDEALQMWADANGYSKDAS